MIYNSKKYPLSLFLKKNNTNVFHKGHYVIYKINKCFYIGKVCCHQLNGGILINTNWQFAETKKFISNEQVLYISKIIY